MRVLYLTLVVYVLDQVSKFAVKGISISWLGIHWSGMSYAQSIHVFGDWCKITFIENPNMAFGLEFGGKILLSIFAILASIGIVVYLARHRTAPLAVRLALALILAGAIGNLTDRLFYGLIYNYATFFHGNVVDFMDFDLFTMRIGPGAFKFWPVFNVADCAVSIGVLLYIFSFKPRPKISTATVTDQGSIERPNQPPIATSAVDPDGQAEPA
jgi:signal peptidase II